MIGLAVVLVTILGCAAFQCFKGTIVRAFATTIVAICASIVAFGYFEVLANIFINRFPSLMPWAHSLSFALLFIVAFAVLQTAAAQLTRQPVDLGFLPERIGRVICGIFLGLILSGLLLTTAAMAPLPNNYPYQRFDERDPSAQRPNKVFLNADGFATGWFSLVSRGSLRAIRNPRSFAVLHPAFLDQIFLNRHNDSGNIPLLTSAESIDVQKKDSVWYVPPATVFNDADANPMTPKSGHRPIVVRMGIRKNSIKDAGKFTPAQLRLICKEKNYAKEPLVGKGINVYPIGYISGKNQIQTKKLNEPIMVVRDDFAGQETRKYIDFVFEVPDDYTPVLLEFKLNNVVEVPRPVSEQVPVPLPFVERSKTRTETTTDQKPDEQHPPASPPANQGQSGSPSRNRGLSNLSRSIVGDQLDEE